MIYFFYPYMHTNSAKKYKIFTNNFQIKKTYCNFASDLSFAHMFDTQVNHIYLTFWTGEKKTGPNKEILISRRCETFGDMVYDLIWTLTYIYKNGKTSQPVSISERANKWDLRKIIRKTEKHEVKRAIEELVEEKKSINTVK